MLQKILEYTQLQNKQEIIKDINRIQDELQQLRENENDGKHSYLMYEEDNMTCRNAIDLLNFLAEYVLADEEIIEEKENN